MTDAYRTYAPTREFQAELISRFYADGLPLYYADRFSRALGKGRIYFKREDLNHTGFHKINNALGQILLAKRMGNADHRRDRRWPTWVATATVAAKFGLNVVYMGEVDMARQALNVFRMKLLAPRCGR